MLIRQFRSFHRCIKRVPDAARSPSWWYPNRAAAGRRSILTRLGGVETLVQAFPDDEIRVIDRYSREVSALLQEQTARLRAMNPEKKRKG
jgi:hypothetical protein